MYLGRADAVEAQAKNTTNMGKKQLGQLSEVGSSILRGDEAKKPEHLEKNNQESAAPLQSLLDRLNLTVNRTHPERVIGQTSDSRRAQIEPRTYVARHALGQCSHSQTAIARWSLPDVGRRSNTEWGAHGRAARLNFPALLIICPGGVACGRIFPARVDNFFWAFGRMRMMRRKVSAGTVNNAQRRASLILVRPAGEDDAGRWSVPGQRGSFEQYAQTSNACGQKRISWEFAQNTLCYDDEGF
ncbi:hypothetical protein FB451DRAFT_1359144 [Mycena latifolia]|nr:hypothetical protein FB451DRAFT_1359144 [Mycena latifolia]